MKTDDLAAGPGGQPPGAENETMDEGMPPEGNEAAEASSGAMEQCLPASALAMPDGENQEELASPEVGDTVDYQVQGKVSRVEGGNVYVMPTSINGNPVEESTPEEAAEPSPEEKDASDLAELQDMAQKQGPMSP